MKISTGGSRRTITLLLAGAAVITGLTAACSLDTREGMCMPDEYPVAAIGYAGGGGCVSEGQKPPSGTVRYPAGEVPQYVDDKWDKYWQNHALDAHGHLMKDPNQIRRS
ncbi:SCO0607 family lipoprotein [Streptomyces sp. NPDC020983]|uniref:SCO0607 family lipoprotein n=1 Tax=Streptomyces sp. NPDC020983 TaxID=3365106 RepID=UPI00378FCC6A